MELSSLEGSVSVPKKAKTHNLGKDSQERPQSVEAKNAIAATKRVLAKVYFQLLSRILCVG